MTSRVSDAFRTDETALRNQEAEEREKLVDWVNTPGRLRIGGVWISATSPSKEEVYIGFIGQAVDTVKMVSNPVEVLSPDGQETARIYVRGSAEWERILSIKSERDQKLEASIRRARAAAEAEIAEEEDKFMTEAGEQIDAELEAAREPATPSGEQLVAKGCAYDAPHFDCEPCMAHFADPARRREHEGTANHKEVVGTEAI